MEQQKDRHPRTLIVGGGLVGICCAIALRDKGHHVSLIDSKEPGQETSRWNAGVLATSSVIPLNHPSLFKKLPALLLGRHAGFRISAKSLIRALPWAVRFLSNALPQASAATTNGLRSLISHSQKCHVMLSERTGEPLWTTGGWLVLYRGPSGMKRAQDHALLLAGFDVPVTALTGDQLADIEPNIGRIYGGAVHVTDTLFTDPVRLIAAYLRLAKTLGVTVLRGTVTGVVPTGHELCVKSYERGGENFDNVVLACGAWTPQLLKPLGVHLPMMVERGYLQKFYSDSAPRRPFLDADCGFVVSPRPGGLQLSTGTELTTLKTAPQFQQFKEARSRMAEAVDVGAPQHEDIAVGNRPTLTDSLPVIGHVQDIPGLWIAAGHQHVGLNTSAGTADLLASLMTGTKPQIDPNPYDIRRFGRRAVENKLRRFTDFRHLPKV